MKILFFAPWYPHRYDPMPGLFIERYADLVAKKNSVAVFHIISVEKLARNYEVAISTEQGKLVVRTYYRKAANPIYKLVKSIVAYWKGLKVILKEFGKPDLVHINVLTARIGLLAYYLKALYNVPYVITEHSSNYLPEKKYDQGFLWLSIVRFVTKHSSGTSAVSEALKNGMIAKAVKHKHFQVIRNIVPEGFFKTNLDYQLTDKKVITNITCFDDIVKNISGLVRVAAELTKKRNDFEIHLVGEGADFNMIANLVKELHLNNVVILAGLLEHEKLIKAYENSAFTVLFSHYETMSVVIAESLACGRPVVATNAGGIPELVSSENGILVEPRNEKELFEKLNEMLDTYGKYDGVKLRKFAYDNFSEEAVEKQLNSFYLKALENK